MHDDTGLPDGAPALQFEGGGAARTGEPPAMIVAGQLHVPEGLTEGQPASIAEPALEGELAGLAQRAAQGVASRGRRRPRRRPLVIALSGVDGSGKTTLCARVTSELESAGVDAARVWARPGYGLGIVGTLIDLLKRASRSDTRSGTKRIVTQSGPTPASRRGVVGWAWALVVTLAYLRDVRRQHRRAREVAIYDRHRIDAEVTLDFLYGGGDRRLHKALVRWALPAPDLAYFIGVDADVVVARNPDSTFGRYAVEEQLWLYRAALPADLPVLDGTLRTDQLAGRVLRDMAELAAPVG
jgi:thymidylate kinase